MSKELSVQQIARICHETNRAYCEAIGDTSQVPWDSAAPWQQESAVKGVQFRLRHPENGPAAQHNEWSDEKIREGWTYGEVKDAEKKTHPCLVSWQSLPEAQRLKDVLFVGVVEALR